MIKFVSAIILGLLGAIIVHIVVLFMVPSYAKNTAWSSLEKNGGMNVFFNVPNSNSIRQFSDPLFALKACRFDLAEAPVHITARSNEKFWSLSIYNRKGYNLYSLNNQTISRGVLDLVIGTPLQIMELRQFGPENLTQSILVREEIKEGFVVLRELKNTSAIDDFEPNFITDARCKKLIF